MRIRRWALTALATVLAAALPNQALAQKPAQPTVEVRLRSINDLLDRAEYIGGLVDKEEPIKQVRGLVKQLTTEGKGLEGIDPKKPFGIYGIVSQDVQSSPVIVMIPIADQERLLAALKDRLQIVPEKAEGGALKVNVPLINEVFLRFANGYLYVGRTAKDLDAKSLIAPKAFFPNDDSSVLSVNVRLDRIPEDAKDLAMGQFEHQVQEGLKKDSAGKNEFEKKMAALTADAFVGAIKMVAKQGKDLSLKVLVDSKTDELSLELGLTAKDGTTLEKTFAGLSGRTSVPAAIVMSKTPAASLNVKAGLPDDLKKRLAPVIDQIVKDAIDKANDGGVAERILAPLAATAKAGNADFAASLVGPDAKGKYSVVAAAMIKDAKELEKVLRDFSAAIPANAAEITFDAEKVGKFAVHKIVVNLDDPNLKEKFGTKNVWLAVSGDCIALSIEPEGALLMAGLKAKPAAAPVVHGQVALSRIISLIDPKLKPDQIKALNRDAFGKGGADGKDIISLSIDGGKQLSVKFTAKGRVIRFGAMKEQLKSN